MTTLADLLGIINAATQGPLTQIRYEHGGGRRYREEPRQLVADTYSEGDREFIATFSPEVCRALVGVAQCAADDRDGSSLLTVMHLIEALSRLDAVLAGEKPC